MARIIIDNQEIEFPWINRIVRAGQNFPEHPQWPLPLQEVDGRNEPWKMVPWIDMNSTLSAQYLHEFAVHDAEIQTELVPHLIVPLDLQ